MIAPASMDALADVARALGFELRRIPYAAVPGGVDHDRVQEQMHFGIYRGDWIEFDGTSRECAAFLIGWRDLRTQALGALRAVDAQLLPEMSARTACSARDAEGRRCMGREGHPLDHVTTVRWHVTKKESP